MIFRKQEYRNTGGNGWPLRVMHSSGQAELKQWVRVQLYSIDDSIPFLVFLTKKIATMNNNEARKGKYSLRNKIRLESIIAPRNLR
jgi:hypothetical protein